MDFKIQQPNPALVFTRPATKRGRTTGIVIHHYHHSTATPQDVHRWHLNNGWLGIGYNVVVNKDGTIYEGRGLDMQGAHATGHNSNTIGIAVQGRYDDHDTEMPAAQFDALVNLIQYIRGVYGYLPVYAHRDVGATACPGRHFPMARLLDAVTNPAEMPECVPDETTEDDTEIHCKPGVCTFPVSVENLVAMVERGVLFPPCLEAMGLEHWTRKNTTQWMDELFTNAAKPDVLDKRIDNGITDLTKALKVLEMAGVMNSPEYWRTAGVDDIIIRMANRALDPLHRIVWAEARGEDVHGQILVVNVILNRHNSPRFPNGIYNVIHAHGVNSQGVKTWQFSPVGNGSYARATPTRTQNDVVNLALGGRDDSQGATFFHAISHLTPDTWHERALTKLFDHGNHRFYVAP
jgi:hypothetical protein